MTALPAFTQLAAARDPDLDVLALALAAEFREVDVPGAIATLDALGEELSRAASSIDDAELQARACAQLLGETHGFAGDREDYDSPENSMLDLVLVRRRGLPILLSVLYVEVARRAGIMLAGVGLPGHFVVGHFGTHPPVLIDPFEGGGTLRAHVPDTGVRPWGAHETAMRMLNNLVIAYQRRGDVAAAIRAAGMRLALPSAGPHRATLEAEWRAMQARLN